MDRRRVLELFQSCAIAAAAWPLVRNGRARAASPSRPRFYLQIIPQGGVDAVYTTDPKKATEVDPGIDVPYAANDIVETGGTRLGPSFRALAPWMPRLAIVNAFHQNSANHVSGFAHITRYKSRATMDAPALFDILGSRRHGEAVGSISIGAGFPSGFSSRYLGAPSEVVFGARPGMFEHLDRADPEDLVEVAAALRLEAKPLGGARATAEEKVTADNMLASAELLSQVARIPKFKAVDWGHKLEGDYRNGADLQRALWLFENGLTRCVTVCVGNQDFDTHFGNTTIQPMMAEYLAFLLDKLFAELDRRSIDNRSLASQMLVIVGSEIGRFPRLNAAHGKDHFPQTPHVLFGAGIVTGATYGATGRSMEAVPISLANGRPQSGGHTLRVDDLGVTLLDLDGANPELHGYVGEHLRFLTG